MFSGIRIEKNMILAFVAVEILAVLLGVVDYRSENAFNGELQRPVSGEPNATYELSLESDLAKEKVKVNVSPISRTPEEIEALFDAAQEEIAATVAGANEDLSHVFTDLNIKDTYQSGVVKAAWSFDNVNLIDPGGKLLMENIKEVSQVRVFCDLSCESSERTYMFSVILYPPVADNQSGYEYLLNKSLSEADSISKGSDSLTLPTKLQNLELVWSIPKSLRAIQLALFGILAFALMMMSQKEKEKANHKKRMEELEADYPDIVSNLSLYVGAGISVKSAVERIAETYKKRVLAGAKIRPGFEGICILQREMNDGKGEIESYKAFGKRMGNKNYRKLSILLVQNIRKGTSALSEMLEKEEHQAFEERKMRAKILGEEASTKLLLPMVLLLMIVLFVLVFPAMQGINI